jgi:hypothetical protein
MKLNQRLHRYLASLRATGGNANTVAPANVVVSRNLGSDGGVHVSSHRQTVRVRQTGRETYKSERNEEVETSDG